MNVGNYIKHSNAIVYGDFVELKTYTIKPERHNYSHKKNGYNSLTQFERSIFNLTKEERIKAREQKVMDTRFKNSYRTRNAFIRLVIHNATLLSPDMSVMTLTFNPLLFGADRNDYNVTRLAVTSFLSERLKDLYPDYSYIAVPEQHEKGGFHYHVITWGIPLSVVNSERSSRYLAGVWANGFIDYAPARFPKGVAGYMAKYFSKAYTSDWCRGKRSYTASSNIKRPLELRGQTQVSYLENIIGSIIDDGRVQFEKTYNTKYHGVAVRKIYDVSSVVPRVV